MASASSSSSASHSSSSTPATPRFPPLAPVKDEYEEKPRTRSSGGGIVIRERRAPSPPRGTLSFVRPKPEPGAGSSRVKKPKPEPVWQPPPAYAATQLQLKAPEDPEDFPGQREVERASFHDVPPASLEFALAWSKAEAEKEAAEKERRRQAAQRTLWDGNFVDLAAAADDAGPSQWWGGDDGQGCSRPPKDEPPSDGDI